MKAFGTNVGRGLPIHIPKVPEICRIFGSISILPHMDFRAAALKPHFVHKLVDQIDSATVRGENVLTIDGAVDRGGVKSRTWIANDNQHSA